MKIRMGFVSNSSSSSFALVGIRTKIKDINKKDLKPGKYVAILNDIEWGEGCPTCDIDTPEMLDFLIKHSSIKECFEVFAQTSDGETVIKNTDFPKNKKLVLYADTISMGGITDVSELYEAYGVDDESGPKDDVRLECTDGSSNKFYEMHDNEDGTFTATYGPIGGRSTSTDYDIEEWDKKFNEKINKGYYEV
jgi:hypothetical protein